MMAVDRSALVACIGRLEASVRDHARTDRVFVNWWLLTFAISWMTLGAGLIYYYIARLTRVNDHIGRKRAYHEALAEFTRLYAEDTGQAELAGPHIAALGASLAAAGRASMRPIPVGRDVALIVVTLGVWGLLVVFRRLNRAWDDLQRFEAAQTELLNAAWLELGLIAFPIEFKIDESKSRAFVPNFLLVVLTLGTWGLFWDYRVHNDPNRMYPAFNKAETAFLRVARQKAGLAWSTRPYFEPDVSVISRKVKVTA